MPLTGNWRIKACQSGRSDDVAIEGAAGAETGGAEGAEAAGLGAEAAGADLTGAAV